MATRRQIPCCLVGCYYLVTKARRTQLWSQNGVWQAKGTLQVTVESGQSPWKGPGTYQASPIVNDDRDILKNTVSFTVLFYCNVGLLVYLNVIHNFYFSCVNGSKVCMNVSAPKWLQCDCPWVWMKITTCIFATCATYFPTLSLIKTLNNACELFYSNV